MDEPRVYHSPHREGTALCTSCRESGIESALLEARSHMSRQKVGMLAELRERPGCWFCSTIFRLCYHEMPPRLFRQCHEENVELVVSQMPGRWRRRAMLEEAEFYGIVGKSPSLTLSYERQNGDTSLIQGLDEFLVDWDLIYDHVYRTNNLPRIRRLDDFEIEGGKADYGRIRSWLSNCPEYHTQPAASAERGAGVFPDMLLIDVVARSVVSAAASARYVALSYVWGPQQPSTGGSTSEKNSHTRSAGETARAPKLLSSNLPQTIVDAMCVVAELGERYLWVDAYCIDQNESPERTYMIKNMHHIYQDAVLTICAISSGNSASGLSGISRSFRRRPQYSATTESGTFIAHSCRGVRNDLLVSAWCRRGWTLQESLLSRNRLCFGDNGITLFGTKYSWHDYVTAEEPKKCIATETAAAGYSQGPFCFWQVSQNTWNFRMYTEFVADYTHRALSKASDIDNAIAGLLSQIRLITRTEFSWGLPVQELLPALLWDGSHLRRFHQFPSWSWLGWQGHVGYEEKPPCCFTIPFSAFSVACDTPVPGSLHIHSYVARFELALVSEDADVEHSEEGSEFHSWRFPTRGDRWEIYGKDDEPLEGDLEGGLNCGFWVDGEISDRMFGAGSEMVEFLLLQRWSEEGPSTHGECTRKKRLKDLMWLMVLLKNTDGTAERIAMLRLPFRYWPTADVRLDTVHIV